MLIIVFILVKTMRCSTKTAHASLIVKVLTSSDMKAINTTVMPLVIQATICISTVAALSNAIFHSKREVKVVNCTVIILVKCLTTCSGTALAQTVILLLLNNVLKIDLTASILVLLMSIFTGMAHVSIIVAFLYKIELKMKNNSVITLVRTPNSLNQMELVLIDASSPSLEISLMVTTTAEILPTLMLPVRQESRSS